MVVVDTNVIAYALIDGPASDDARVAFARDPEWVAPTLWRSEFRSVLVSHVKMRVLSQRAAVEVFANASDLLGPRERSPDTASVLALAVASGCSAYDCEFVAVAKTLGVPLVTNDKQVLKAFPTYAVSLSDFVKAG